MKRLTLTRYLDDDHGTVGILRLGRHRVCWMVEPPARENRRNYSRIPAGEYIVRHLVRSASGKYRDVYHVQGVPQRSGIMIHRGNYTGDRKKGKCTDSYGCLLPADRLGVLACVNGYQRVGIDSTKAMRLLHAAAGRETFILEIKNA